MQSDYLIVSVQDFKTNFCNYLNMLEARKKRGIVVRRYKKRVAMLVLLERKPPPEKNADQVN